MVHSKAWFMTNVLAGSMRFAMLIYAKQRFTSKGCCSFNMW